MGSLILFNVFPGDGEGTYFGIPNDPLILPEPSIEKSPYRQHYQQDIYFSAGHGYL